MRDIFKIIKKTITSKKIRKQILKLQKIFIYIIKNNSVEAHKELTTLIKDIEQSFSQLQYKKVVININHYGFGLSEKALQKLSELKEKEINESTQFEILRDDPHLIFVVESMGIDANDSYSKLAIVKIPNGIEYEIKNIRDNERVYIYGQDYTNQLLK